VPIHPGILPEAVTRVTQRHAESCAATWIFATGADAFSLFLGASSATFRAMSRDWCEEGVVTRRFLLGVAGLAILTVVATVWLPAGWGFLGAVLLAIVWCIALDRDTVSGAGRSAASVEMSRARRADLLRDADEAVRLMGGPVDAPHVDRLGLATRIRCARLERKALGSRPSQRTA
jgi:hypothetical protein